MQEATAGDMIHSLWELIEYGSSIITLFPGDVVNNGTSGGVGMGTAVRGAQRFLQPGEQISASIDGIGTLNLSVVSEPEPQGLTGAHLPPVRTYRGAASGGGLTQFTSRIGSFSPVISSA